MPCDVGPHPKLERDLQQEVEDGRQPLTLVRTATDTVTTTLHVGSGASGTSFTFESSCEHLTSFVNDAELAILSMLCYNVFGCHEHTIFTHQN